MTDDVKYDKHYRDDPAACGTPFAEFDAFCGVPHVNCTGLSETPQSPPRIHQGPE